MSNCYHDAKALSHCMSVLMPFKENTWYSSYLLSPSATPSLVSTKNLHTHVYWNIIYKSQYTKTTKMFNNMSMVIFYT